MKQQITVGLLAHVDAGKTTLTESILYGSGTIRKQGRVDHRDTFLDTDPVERERGITVYAKQARFSMGDIQYTLLDTPGHADLSPEMERTLWVLDYAILLISAQDGVTAREKLLFRLLEHYAVPAFLFVNKMDRPDTDRSAIFENIRKELGSACVDFSDQASDVFREAVALSDEKLLDDYLNGVLPAQDDIRRVIRERKLFPVWFGSALHNEGTAELMQGMADYMQPCERRREFGAKIYKIARDNKGTRLAFLKITGGKLEVKQNISYEKEGMPVQEKIDQIRLYSGGSYEAVSAAEAGTAAAVTGLSGIRAGDALGTEQPLSSQIIEPVLTYELEYAPEVQTQTVLDALKKVEEEEPRLHVRQIAKTGKITVQVMGQVQMEILARQLLDRFGITVGFGEQTILYKETIARAVEGVGHFEPLRHYAEVRLLLEPLERGSGIQFGNLCPRDELEPHWQKLILSHLNEREHTGVLTDSPLTDMRISLLGGKAHTKHTESGDFRQAVFRAIRQGLMESVSVLLEPYYDFVLTVPEGSLGRALFDLNQMGAENAPPLIENGMCEITGRAPASELGSYQEKVTVYTAGAGRLSCSVGGYEPCRNVEEVVERIGYDPDRDPDNPSSSVFCSHGAGLIIPWYQVKDRMHTESTLPEEALWESEEETIVSAADSAERKNRQKAEENLSFKEQGNRIAAGEKELQEIFERTYGAKQERAARPGWKAARKKADLTPSAKPKKPSGKADAKEYLLVDGYNIIFAWPELKALAERDIHAARDQLMDRLSDYQGMRSGTLILVFDAWKVPGGREEVIQYHNIYVVYTRESETADQYIEKTVHDLGKHHKVTVATSDGLEQMIILGEGAVRQSAAGLLEDVTQRRKQLQEEYLGDRGRFSVSLGSRIEQAAGDRITSPVSPGENDETDDG